MSKTLKKQQSAKCKLKLDKMQTTKKQQNDYLSKMKFSYNIKGEMTRIELIEIWLGKIIAIQKQQNNSKIECKKNAKNSKIYKNARTISYLMLLIWYM